MLSRAGRIDVLINNAGVNLVGAIEETSIGQAQALFDTNVIGVLRMIQAVLPGMRRQGAGQIVNISSILGLLPAPFMGVYASTKHAVEGLSESLDHEVRGFGIRVVLIEPPYTRTNLDASAAQAEGRIDVYAAQRRPHGGSDHPKHQLGARAQDRRRGGVAIDRRVLPHATADRPGRSPELAPQAATGRDVRARVCGKHSRSIHRGKGAVTEPRP